MGVMTDGAFARLAASGKRALFPKGSELFRQGDAATSLFMVLEGLVSVRREHRQVSDAVVLGSLGSGEVVGAMGLLEREPRAATVLAVENTVAIEISADVVRAIIAEHPGEYAALARVLGQRPSGTTSSPLMPQRKRK